MSGDTVKEFNLCSRMINITCRVCVGAVPLLCYDGPHTQGVVRREKVALTSQ